ncbi:MAG: hypothetical protein ACRDTH_08850 [Pseudonocardiaceae bacterium]
MMSRDIGGSRTFTMKVRLLCFSGWGSWFDAAGLVVVSGVDGEFAQELPGGGVEDADVEVVDEQDDVGSGVGSADADVVEPAVDAEGDDSGFVDLVVSGAVVGVAVAVAGRGGFWSGRVGGGGSGPVR